VFLKYGTGGDVINHDALCILSLNIINEKVISPDVAPEEKNYAGTLHLVVNSGTRNEKLFRFLFRPPTFIILRLRLRNTENNVKFLDEVRDRSPRLRKVS
jgi:hypothetical protein